MVIRGETGGGGGAPADGLGVWREGGSPHRSGRRRRSIQSLGFHLQVSLSLWRAGLCRRRRRGRPCTSDLSSHGSFAGSAAGFLCLALWVSIAYTIEEGVVSRLRRARGFHP